MNQNSISKNKFGSHQNSQQRGAEDYLRSPFVSSFSYAPVTLPSVGGSYTHDMNKQVQAAPAGLYSSSTSGPMTGAGPQHHQPGLGGPVPNPPSASLVPTQGQQLNARPHMAQMTNYSRQNTSRQVPNMSRSSITTVVSQSPQQLQHYGTVPLYAQQAAAYTMQPQPTMIMPSPHVINYQRPNLPTPHQFSMPSTQTMYLPGSNWSSYNQPTVFFGQVSHMTSTCPQIPTQMPVQAGPKKPPSYKGIPIIDPVTGRDVRQDITNEPPPPPRITKDNQQETVQDYSVIFAEQVSQALAGDSVPKVVTPDAVDIPENNSCDLPPSEDEIEISEFQEQYNEQEAVVCTENPTVPYYSRDSGDLNSISETVSLEKINSTVSSEPVSVEIPQTVEYCQMNDTEKTEDYSLSPSNIEIPCKLELSEAADEKENNQHSAVCDETIDSEEPKAPEETEVLPRPLQVDVESVTNLNNDDDSVFKHPGQVQKSQQPVHKVKSQQNGDVHKTSYSVTAASVSKEEKPSAEVGKKKKGKKNLNKRGESKEGGDMDAFLDKSEEVVTTPTKTQVQQPPQPQQPLIPAAATVINRPDSPVTASVHDSELQESENEKIQQNDISVISDQLQDGPALSGGETEAKDTKDSPVEEAPKNQIALKYSYKEDQWSPLNPEGKKQYDRDFLLNLQSQPMSMKKPSNLPNLEVIKDKATLHKLNEVNNRMTFTAPYAQRIGYTDPFEPSFTKSAPGRPMHPGGIKRGSQQRGSENKMPTRKVVIPLVKEPVILHTAEKAWAPTRNKDDSENNDVRTQLLYKRVRGILNKLTPQKFSTLVSQVRQLDITTEESLNGVIDLVFEKAIDEPNFSVPYANMCKHLAMLKVNSGVEGQSINFRKLLLTKCQREFERDRTDEQNRAERMRRIVECETDEKRKQLQEDFDEEERINRRRQLGNIRFIGELFKLGMLTESIMHQCIKKLLFQGDEDSLECLCRLLTTIGKELENEKKSNNMLMESYFTDMKKTVGQRKTSSRVRFMLQDVIDLRMNNWVPRRDENNPKTIDQIHKEAEKEAHEQQQMLQQMTYPKRMPDDRDRRKNRPPMSEDGWNTSGKSSKGNYSSVDPMKLKLTKPAEIESMQLGPGGKFTSWGKGSSGGAKSSNLDHDSRPAPLQNRYSVLADQPTPALYEARRSSQRSAASSRESSRGRNSQLPPSAMRKTPSVSRERDNAIEAVKSFTRMGVPEQRPSENRRPQEAQNVNGKDDTATLLKGAELSVEDIEKKTKPLIDEFLHNCDLEEAVRCVLELASPSTVCVFITSAVNQVLERSSQSRHMLGKLLHTLLKRKIITMEEYNKGLKDVLEFVDEYSLDIPLIWDYLGELIEPILDDDDISLGFLKDTLKPCIPSLTAGKLVSAFLLCASKKRGTLRVGEMWKESKLSWTDFLKPETDVEDFLKSHKLEFTTKQNVEPKLKKQITPEEMKQNLQRLLREHESNEEIFNWLETHIEGEMSPPVYRALVTVIYESVITGSGANCELNASKLKERMCILARYMDVNRNLELHAIFALQYLMNKLDHPKGILLQIFDLAYNEDFLSDDAFKQWEHCDDPAEQEGKGVAIHSVSSFFTWLKEGDDDESADGD